MLENTDRPWLFRTYAGHSTAESSNQLYRKNLSKGQTGLSVAFDLPTQTGYDSDDELAKGEVGKVGVPISHVGDMRRLFDQIPLEEMNTSMTINATAPWLLALYVVVAEEQGADVSKLRGTVQNDIIKEYLSRGTYIFPPEASLKLIGDVARFTVAKMPKWNPMNVCSYHLQEAGARPEQELAYALATALTVLDEIRPSVSHEVFENIVGSISFFVNSGIKFVTEMCKMRAFVEMWDEICVERYDVTDAKKRRFRYGVQVNSLGLTEAQPENNVYRVLIEMLGVTLSRGARARAVQLPAWNEALGLPRPWDQQWSLRMQQIMAYETDLLQFGDLFDGNAEVDDKTQELKALALAELAELESAGGAIHSIERMKSALVTANAERIAQIETGDIKIVGVNCFETTEESPLGGGNDAIMTVDPKVEAEQIANVKNWREARDQAAWQSAADALRNAVKSGASVMEASIEAARAGMTTGEWASILRAEFGEYRAPTGVPNERRNDGAASEEVLEAVAEFTKANGRAPKLLIGKPGLDGHSNGAEQVALRARDGGFEVDYQGIRLTPEEIVAAAKAQKPDAIGLSILSGSHMPLLEDVMGRLEAEGLRDIPLFVGGIIPEDDHAKIGEMGVSAIYTPKDFDMNKIMLEILQMSNGR